MYLEYLNLRTKGKITIKFQYSAIIYCPKLLGFEIAEDMQKTYSKLIYVTENGFPIGFRPTMHTTAMNAKKRDSECQQYSFEMSLYSMLHDKLPWDTDQINLAWGVNMAEACEKTIELRQKVDLKARNFTYDKILNYSF